MGNVLAATVIHQDPNRMSLTLPDIERIAHLARLEFNAEQQTRLLGQLNGFFDIVDQMQAVNTDGITPLAHPTEVMGEVALRLRPDVVSEPNQREANQRSAPAVEQGLFLVDDVEKTVELAEQARLLLGVEFQAGQMGDALDVGQGQRHALGSW